MFGVRLHCMKSVEAYLFVPYWMVNKTGTALQYKVGSHSETTNVFYKIDSCLGGRSFVQRFPRIDGQECSHVWFAEIRLEKKGEKEHLKANRSRKTCRGACV